MDDRIEPPIISSEEKAKLQRDIAIDQAARLASERNIAEAQRNAALLQNEVLRDESRSAKVWAANNAVAKSQAESEAVAANSEARTSATGFFVLLAIIVVVGLCTLIWYSNHQTTVVEAPPVERIINNPVPAAPAPAPSPTIITAPTAPAPSVTINNPPPAPRNDTPNNTIIVQPPSMAPSANPQPTNNPNTYSNNNPAPTSQTPANNINGQ